MRNADEAFTLGELGQHIRGDGLLHSPSDVVERYFICEAHIFPKEEMRDLNIEILRRVLDKCSRETAIGIRVGDAPAVNEDNKHEYSFVGWRRSYDFCSAKISR